MFIEIMRSNVKRVILSLLFLAMGAVIFQGFQCTSKELTTAKVAYNNKEYDKVIEYAKKDLQKNPQSAPTHTLLAQTYFDLKQYIKSAKSAKKAQDYAKDQKTVSAVKQIQNRLWTTAYNEGISFYNQYFAKTQDNFLDSAINYFNVGIEIRPQLIDFYYFKGRVLEIKGDSAQAEDAYMNYIATASEEIDFLKSNNMYLNIPRNKSIELLGEPDNSKGSSQSNGDSVITDYYTMEKENVYIFYKSVERDPFKLFGLRVSPPDFWMDGEKSMPTEMRVSPLAALAQIKYEQGDLEKALEFAQQITTIDPNNQQVNRFTIDLYVQLDRTDEAVESLQELVESDPGNKLYWTQFGDLYLNMGQFQDAIDKYKKALEIDKDDAFALRNVATCYKNMASTIQKRQNKLMEEDENYEPKPQEYFPLLRKSAQYFERSLATKEFKNNFTVLGELANIYSVLEEEEDLKKIVKKLEAIEFSVAKENKEQYYLTLLKIYSDLNNTDKLKVIQEKLDRIK